MEISDQSKNIGAPEMSHLKMMRSMIYDLRKSKVSLKAFIKNQNECIEVLSQRQHEWKKEYVGLVSKIDKLSTGNASENVPTLSEDKVLKIERVIKAMEFMLTMAEKKTLK